MGKETGDKILGIEKDPVKTVPITAKEETTEKFYTKEARYYKSLGDKHILDNADVKLLVIENSTQLNELLEVRDQLANINRIVGINELGDRQDELENSITLSNWLTAEASALISTPVDSGSLATIVYTSGTTGKPKGVMLSHDNILSNVYAGLAMVDVFTQDVFLSFLPLSHMLERSVGYYLPIVTGSRVAFARSIPNLAADLLVIKPTIMISVPRIFERVYAKINGRLATESTLKRKLFKFALKLGWKQFQYQQGVCGWSIDLLLQPLFDRLVGAKIRDRLGGKLRFTVCGGAALSGKIAQFFIGLGVPILQGYGLTETSPVISVNQLQNNIPESVGLPLPGVEVCIGDNDELLTRSRCVMMGYWKNEQATRAVIDQDNWLHTGDKAKIENGHIFITGRIKEIIVLANGEKVSPSDMEMAISLDNMVEQVLIIGEARPYLSALLVLNESALAQYASELDIDVKNWEYFLDDDLIMHVNSLIRDSLHDFPGYAKIRRIGICPAPWNVENGMLTPTLKIRKQQVFAAYAAQIEQLYDGHS